MYDGDKDSASLFSRLFIHSQCKGTIKRVQNKGNLNFFEREYLRAKLKDNHFREIAHKRAEKVQQAL
ncbi:MAG: hypothetical protein IJT11_03020, partial [Bacteroidaceae bacterium]|nr:hypothetical protein [Bacteroidaceae bacterium]